MATAFVFINVETGSEREVARELRKIPIVKEAYVTYGVYDIVTRVEAESLDKLKETVTANIRRLDNVRSTLTTIVAGWPQGHFTARPEDRARRLDIHIEKIDTPTKRLW